MSPFVSHADVINREINGQYIIFDIRGQQLKIDCPDSNNISAFVIGFTGNIHNISGMLRLTIQLAKQFSSQIQWATVLNAKKPSVDDYYVLFLRDVVNMMDILTGRKNYREFDTFADSMAYFRDLIYWLHMICRRCKSSILEYMFLHYPLLMAAYAIYKHKANINIFKKTSEILKQHTPAKLQVLKDFIKTYGSSYDDDTRMNLRYFTNYVQIFKHLPGDLFERNTLKRVDLTVDKTTKEIMYPQLATVLCQISKTGYKEQFEYVVPAQIHIDGIDLLSINMKNDFSLLSILKILYPDLSDEEASIIKNELSQPVTLNEDFHMLDDEEDWLHENCHD